MQSLKVVVLTALLCVGVTASPVEKVVKLLTDMQANIKADGAAEKELFAKFSCWCTGMTKKKGAAIDQAKVDLIQLGSDIQRLRGEISSHSSDINSAADEMKTNHETQQTRTEAREKENAAFTALRAEMGQAMQSLGQALKMLKMAPQFLQTKTALSAQQAAALTLAIDKFPDRVLGSLPKEKLAQIQSVTAAVAKGQYTPSYNSLVTILEGMQDQFTTDLKAETGTEDTSKSDYAGLMKTSVEELNTLQDTIDTREGEKAKAASDLATATQDYDDTETQMNADVDFFNDAVDQCEKKAGAWTTRQSMRTEELAGVAEAIKILSSDEARALFATSINAASRVGRSKNAANSLAATIDFLQVETLQMQPAQNKAFQVIKDLARKSQNVGLARIAAQVRLASKGHFTVVMGAIDDVIGVLKSEQTADNDKKKQCKDEYHKIEQTSKDEAWEIEKNEAEIAKLEATIAKREAEKAETVQAISDVKQEILDMAAQRLAEKQAYDKAKKDDDDAIVLLGQAKTALEKFAKDNGIEGAEAFLQDPDDVLRGESAPKAKFSDKGSRAGQTKGIGMLLKTIIEGLQDELKVQKEVEDQAILDHTKADKAADDLQKALEDKEANLITAIADRNTEKTAENKKLTDNKADLKSEVDYKAKIKPDCEFTLNNWQDRFNKRKAEMDGLLTAKEFLAGAMFVQINKH